MVNQSFPPPFPQPLQRLHVYDGLMMNAERWGLAHHYHRQRQNVHYQSLNEPGIVCGLGVRVIQAPSEANARFRDKRWVEIQPGIAIDLDGNPIIVDPSIDRKFRIATSAPTTGTLTVYLVASYVEPDNPGEKVNSSHLLREWFRFDEKTTPPTDREVELCRIELRSGIVELENPEDILFPGYNQINLHHRRFAKARPQAIVRVATTLTATCENLLYLMQSISSLYPSLHGSTEIGQVNLDTNLNDYDLVYIAGLQAMNLYDIELERFTQYLKTGGVILIELPSPNSDRSEKVKKAVAYQFQISLQSWRRLSANHPLRSQPFLFAKPPQINQQSVQLWNGGGIILIEGDLSAAWGLDENLDLERHEIRSAQEFGINILNFALQRRHMTQLLQETNMDSNKSYLR